MLEHDRTHDQLPLPLGFVVEERTVASGRFPDMPYRGAERRYFGLDPDTLLAAWDRSGPPLPPVWERYFAADDSGRILWDRALAHSLVSDFAGEGVDLEVAYLEVAGLPDPDAMRPGTRERWLVWWDGARTWVNQQPQRVEHRPHNLLRLGLDLSFPFPSFHSVIHSPGPSVLQEPLRRTLNEHGLIDDLDVAVFLMNEVYRSGWDGREIVALDVWLALPPGSAA